MPRRRIIVYTICSPIGQEENSRLAVEKSVTCASLSCASLSFIYPITKLAIYQIVLTGRSVRSGLSCFPITRDHGDSLRFLPSSVFQRFSQSLRALSDSFKQKGRAKPKMAGFLAVFAFKSTKESNKIFRAGTKMVLSSDPRSSRDPLCWPVRIDPGGSVETHRIHAPELKLRVRKP